MDDEELRHVLAFTICWGYLRWVNIDNTAATFVVDMLLFAAARSGMV